MIKVDALEPNADMPTPQRLEHYPPWVESEHDRTRWDLSAAIAKELFGGDGPAAVWMATRSIFNSPVPTGEMSERRADEARDKPPIPMPVNEPGEYLDAPDPMPLEDLEPEARAEVGRELAERREAREPQTRPS